MKKVNKTEEIRKEASRMAEKGNRPRPLEVAKSLKKRGIHVVGSQVSMALKGTGMEYRPSPQLPDLRTAMKKVNITDLKAAQNYLEQVGTMDKAIAALVAFLGTAERPQE